jgi:D-beta-D-heptose 7-phosphate kinase/D-beta-D-heptose 1-phosphate adenosyltransferase
VVKVWTNGCFDVLHRGHFEMLKYAKSLGDYLIVGIDSDAKVKRDKGFCRPFNNVFDRKFALESIRYVDSVVVFGSRKALRQTLKAVSPDVMVVGSDWEGKEVVGQEFASDVKFFERVGEYSTTKVLESKK